MSDKVLKVWLIKSYADSEIAFSHKVMEQLGDKLGIRIELHQMIWERILEMLLDAFSRDEAPDVFMLGFTWIRTLAYLKLLKPLPGDITTRPVLAPWMSECTTYQGQTIAIPWLADPVMLNCRLDIMDMHRIRPDDLSTRQGLLTVCERIESSRKKQGIKNISAMNFILKPPISMLNRNLAFLYKEGWEFPEYGKSPVNFSSDPHVITGLNHIWELMRVCGAKFSNVLVNPKAMYDIYYKDKQFAFHNGGPNGVISGILNEQTPAKRQYTVVPLPGNTPNSKTFGGGSALAVSSTTREPELAFKVLEYLNSEEFMKEWVPVTGNMPATEMELWDEYRKFPEIGHIRREIEHSCLVPLHPLGCTLEKVLSYGFSDLFWKLLSVPKIPKDITSAMDVLKNLDVQSNALIKLLWGGVS